jgi:hypothetical protein
MEVSAVNVWQLLLQSGPKFRGVWLPGQARLRSGCLSSGNRHLTRHVSTQRTADALRNARPTQMCPSGYATVRRQSPPLPGRIVTDCAQSSLRPEIRVPTGHQPVRQSANGSRRLRTSGRTSPRHSCQPNETHNLASECPSKTSAELRSFVPFWMIWPLDCRK